MKLSTLKSKTKLLSIALLAVSLTSVLSACHEEEDIDFRAPTISIDSPTPGSNVSSTNVTISGIISSDVVLVELSLEDDTGTVISGPVQATLAGTSFSGSLTLSVGDNIVNAMAQDAVGNRNSIKFNLHYAQLSFSDTTADVVIGQADYTANDPNRGSMVAANSLSNVQGTLYQKNLTTLYIPDTANNRVLGFNSIPASDGIDASFVLGQANLTSNTAGLSSTAFTSPNAVYTTSTQLFVADSGNNRVLIWDSHPTTNATAAAHVIGQVDFMSNAVGCSSRTLSNPVSIYVVDDRVVVLDKGNHRVLIWNAIPDADGVAADLVIGQQNMNFCQLNDNDGDGMTDSVTASTLNNPGGMWTDGERLLVADTDNNRVLVWNTFPATNGQVADVVIGQVDMTSSMVNNLNGPMSVSSNLTQIFVADTGNTRVLVFDNFPAVNNEVEDSSIGPGFSYDLPTPGMTSFTSVNNVYVDRSRLFVVDDNRILIFNAD